MELPRPPSEHVTNLEPVVSHRRVRYDQRLHELTECIEDVFAKAGGRSGEMRRVDKGRFVELRRGVSRSMAMKWMVKETEANVSAHVY